MRLELRGDEISDQSLHDSDRQGSGNDAPVRFAPLQALPGRGPRGVWLETAAKIRGASRPWPARRGVLQSLRPPARWRARHRAAAALAREQRREFLEPLR